MKDVDDRSAQVRSFVTCAGLVWERRTFLDGLAWPFAAKGILPGSVNSFRDSGIDRELWRLDARGPG